MSWALAAVVIGCGGVAALVRYLVAVWFSDDRFPWAVLTVNVVGSALAGVVLALGGALTADIQLVLLAGVAGGLTTFSTFSVETVQLLLDRRARVAALNVGLNLGAGLAVTALVYAVVLWVVAP